MPENQDPLLVPVPGDGDIQEEDMAAADPTANQALAQELIGQSMGQLSNTAVVAQNNFVTVSKFADYDFMEQRRIIDLAEALGGREVASKQVPAGPTSLG